jgi:hypothetical protein
MRVYSPPQSKSENFPLAHTGLRFLSCSRNVNIQCQLMRGFSLGRPRDFTVTQHLRGPVFAGVREQRLLIQTVQRFLLMSAVTRHARTFVSITIAYSLSQIQHLLQLLNFLDIQNKNLTLGISYTKLNKLLPDCIALIQNFAVVNSTQQR